jgi:Transposase DDE domain group 1
MICRKNLLPRPILRQTHTGHIRHARRYAVAVHLANHQAEEGDRCFRRRSIVFGWWCDVAGLGREACGDLCSQPTISRLENAPDLRDTIRLTYALIDQWIASYKRPPDAVTLDIDETCDTVHGHQQLSLFNAYYDERCFLPIHVYDTEHLRPVAVILRPGKTPSGIEIRGHLRRLVRRIRQHWPTTRITFRGDSHYACPEVMTLRSLCDRLLQRRRCKSSGCEANSISYIFGLAGSKPLAKKVEDEADAIRTERAVLDQDVVRGFAETTHRAGSWTRSRRVVARIEATRLGCDHRYVVTNMKTGTDEWLYDSLYCVRGQAQNLIKLHKSQLASDRTSCRSPLANQIRLVLHTAAYWLMLAVRDAIPKTQDLAIAEFKTIRLRLLKIAARVIETKSRIRVAFATACPEAELFRGLAISLQRCGP